MPGDNPEMNDDVRAGMRDLLANFRGTTPEDARPGEVEERETLLRTAAPVRTSCEGCYERDKEIKRQRVQVDDLRFANNNRRTELSQAASAIYAHCRSIHFLRKGLEAWECHSGRWQKRSSTDPLSSMTTPTAAPEREVLT